MGSFVYVSNASDGDISTYRMKPTGELEVGPRVRAADTVMPLAVSPDRRLLYAGVRSQPYRVFVYGIDRETGDLTLIDTAPLAESMAYLSLDRSGRFLFAAGYGAHVVSVNALTPDGRVSPQPPQVVPTGRNAHSIRVDATNRFVFVPNLGSDQVMQFIFDDEAGRLVPNTPPAVPVKAGVGPRHCLFSNDSRFLYVLGEFLANVLVFAVDGRSGRLTQVGEASGVPAGSPLKPGAPRAPVAAGSTAAPPDTSNDIWAADIRMTPDDRLLYLSERTGSTLAGFRVDRQTGLLGYLGSTPTETQPRGFAIDPAGRFLVASGEQSDRISVYAIDPAEGTLSPLGRYPVGRGANWVEIVGFD